MAGYKWDGGKQMEQLKQIKTCELVKELILRDGVSAQIVEPYEMYDLPTVEGAAVILVIID